MNNSYTLEDIKTAFWETFHKQGELFFSYSGIEERDNADTEYYWNELLDSLAGVDERSPVQERARFFVRHPQEGKGVTQ